ANQKTDMRFIIIWTKPIVIIPITTRETGRYLSNILFKGVKKTIKATIPYVLSSMPVIEESKPISSTLSGKAKASVPLLIIIAKAGSDACKTNGCFNKGTNSEKLNFPFSVDLKDSSINL